MYQLQHRLEYSSLILNRIFKIQELFKITIEINSNRLIEYHLLCRTIIKVIKVVLLIRRLGSISILIHLKVKDHKVLEQIIKITLLSNNISQFSLFNLFRTFKIFNKMWVSLSKIIKINIIFSNRFMFLRFHINK